MTQIREEYFLFLKAKLKDNFDIVLYLRLKFVFVNSSVLINLKKLEKRKSLEENLLNNLRISNFITDCKQHRYLRNNQFVL